MWQIHIGRKAERVKGRSSKRNINAFADRSRRKWEVSPEKLSGRYRNWQGLMAHLSSATGRAREVVTATRSPHVE